jgi:DnaJ-class molecular chaperone
MKPAKLEAIEVRLSQIEARLSQIEARLSQNKEWCPTCRGAGYVPIKAPSMIAPSNAVILETCEICERNGTVPMCTEKRF